MGSNLLKHCAVGIIRTMVAEMVPWKELQPKAFSLMPLVWSIGSVFGPSFGGFFARPAEQYPSLFGNSWLFKRYPFLLPNLVAFFFFLISVIVATLFLHETLETKRGQKDWGLKLSEKISRSFRKRPRSACSRQHRASFVDAEASAPLLPKSGAVGGLNGKKKDADTTGPTMKEIFDKQVTITIIAYTLMALHSVSFDQILPVFLDFPRQIPDDENTHLPFHFSGGFGMNSSEIGMIFTIYGVACGVIQIFCFPPICNRYGALTCFKAGSKSTPVCRPDLVVANLSRTAILFPIVYLLLPYTALIQSPNGQFAALLFILLVKGAAVIVVFPCITILLTNSAPSLRILGTLNGFATTFSGIGRAVGPSLCGTAFSWGVKRGYVIPAFWLLCAIALMQVLPAWMMVEGEGIQWDEDSEEEEPLLGDEQTLGEAERDRCAIIADDAANVHGVREDHVFDDSEDEGFSPLTRVHSQAPRVNGGYGTMNESRGRRG